MAGEGNAFGLSNEAIGWIGVVGSIIFFGTFNVPLKMMKTPPHPIVWSLYFQVPVPFLVSLLTLTYAWPFVFTAWGLLTAALWVPGNIISIYAIRYLGLAVAQGGWSGCIIIISFLWGAFFFHQEIISWPLTILGLLLLCTGIAGLALAGSGYAPVLLRRLPPSAQLWCLRLLRQPHYEAISHEDPFASSDLESHDPDMHDLPLNDRDEHDDAGKLTDSELSTGELHDGQVEGHESQVEGHESQAEGRVEGQDEAELEDSLQLLDSPLRERHDVHDGGSINGEQHESGPQASGGSQIKSSREIMLGVISLLGVAIPSGSMMVPTLLAPPEARAGFDVSMSLGILILGPVFFAAYFIAAREIPEWKFKETAPYAFASSLIWSIGNCMSQFIFFIIIIFFFFFSFFIFSFFLSKGSQFWHPFI